MGGICYSAGVGEELAWPAFTELRIWAGLIVLVGGSAMRRKHMRAKGCLSIAGQMREPSPNNIDSNGARIEQWKEGSMVDKGLKHVGRYI